MRDAVEELGDALGRLGLQQVAGRAAADRGEQVLLGAGRGQDDDLALRAPPHAARGSASSPPDAGHRQVEQDEVRLQLARALDRLLAVAGLADDREVVLLEQADERRAGQRMVVDDKRAPAHTGLIGRTAACRQEGYAHIARDTYLAWVRDEVLLVALLGAALTFFLAQPGAARARTTCRACACSSTRPSCSSP